MGRMSKHLLWILLDASSYPTGAMALIDVGRLLGSFYNVN